MDFASKARKLEQRISRTVDAAVVEFVGRSTTSPIEIVHRVLDRAEAEIQEIGRGRRVFPFNRVRVQVIAGDKESRARMAAVTDGPPSLSDRLVDRLRSSGCAIDRLEAAIVNVRRRGADWIDADFHVEFDRAEVSSAARPATDDHPATAIARLKLTVLKGTAEQRSYAFTSGRVDIGRRSDVVDQRQRLIRTNHVAFTEDGAEENRTVSRKHAHIEFSEADRCYRVWDDRSAHGTTIMRNGRPIRVPAGARGTRLETDDEIVLGYARLRVTVEKRF
jgi:FHA domain-containing protein